MTNQKVQSDQSVLNCPSLPLLLRLGSENISFYGHLIPNKVSDLRSGRPVRDSPVPPTWSVVAASDH